MFCVFCFELEVIFIDFYDNFVIIIYIPTKRSMIFVSPEVIMKT